MTIAENIDCMEGMARYCDQYFDLAIVDPQTGQGEGKNHALRSITIKQRNGSISKVQNTHTAKGWDTSPPCQCYYDELLRVSKYQIIMCENRLEFRQKGRSAGRIVWNLLRANDFGDCQIMWTNLFQKVEYFEFLSNGMLQGFKINDRRQQGNKKLNEKRIHPSQKHVEVYRHLLRRYAKPGYKVLDTHLGSGSSRIAAYDLGLHLVAFEKDKDYFDDQEKRFAGHIVNNSNALFKEEPVLANHEIMWVCRKCGEEYDARRTDTCPMCGSAM